MRLTHKVMISRAVLSSDVGLKVDRMSVPLPRVSGKSSGYGQPMVDIGHRAEENQVSSTSGSRVNPSASSAATSAASSIDASSRASRLSVDWGGTHTLSTNSVSVISRLTYAAPAATHRSPAPSGAVSTVLLQTGI